MVTVVPKSADRSSCLGLATADRVGGSGRVDGGSSDQLVTTPVVHERKARREIANSNERKRMQSINAGFQSLRLLLPHTGPVDRLSKAAILQQAAEYISFLITERQHLLELNRQYIAATTSSRCLPVKRPKGSDGELSDDGSTLYADQLSSSDSRYKRRSPQNCDSQHSRSLPVKKRKDEMTVSSSDHQVCRVRSHSSLSRRNLSVIVDAIRHLEGDRFYCGTGPEESFEGSSGDSDGDDPSVVQDASSVICDNVGHYTCFPDTPEDLSVFHHSRLFLPVSANKNC